MSSDVACSLNPKLYDSSVSVGLLEYRQKQKNIKKAGKDLRKEGCQR